MDINNLTSLNNDEKTLEYNIDNSNKISEYLLQNYVTHRDIDNVKKISLTRPQFYYNARKRNIDNNNEGISKSTCELTNLNRIHQLAPRLHATIPLMTRGGCDVTTENKLKFIENTQLNKKKKSQSIDRFFPQVDKVKSMQDPNHIIPEDSDSDWVRGGQSSRLIVKDKDYENRCSERRAF